MDSLIAQIEKILRVGIGVQHGNHIRAVLELCLERLSASPAVARQEEPMIKTAVDRFLAWKLPADFRPDAGISFKPEYNQHTPWPMKHEPVGTNLFTAEQARAMFEHCLAAPAAVARQEDETLDPHAVKSPITTDTEVRRRATEHRRILLAPEFLKNRVEILRSRDLEIPEFHAMQLQLADIIELLAAALEALGLEAEA